MDTIRDFNESNDSSHRHEAGRFPGADMLESAGEGLDAVVHRLSSAFEAMQSRTVEFRDHGFDRVKDDVVRYTRDQPTNALLIAAGFGLLLGIFAGLCRR